MAEFTFEGKKVYYEIHGNVGEPLVVLNGIMMSTASWKPFIDNFSKNNVLILVDFFDQGKSERLTEAYDHSLQVRLLDELIQRLWYYSVNIMGISYGGEIALQYALAHPNRVNRLVLANTAARTSDELKAVGDEWNRIAATGDGKAYYDITIPIIYSDNFKRVQSKWMDERETMLINYFSNKSVLESLTRLTNSSRNYDVVDRLGEVTCPTLVISGSQDALLPPFEQEIIHKGIKHSVYVTIEGSGHASMYEDPSTFAALTLGFVNLSDEPIKI